MNNLNRRHDLSFKNIRITLKKKRRITLDDENKP